MRFKNILNKAESYLPVLDKRRLLRAYNLAKKAHKGQKRKGGEPYLSHPVSVAEILTELYADEDTLIAALLHDVIEDTPYTVNQIKKLFGQTVVNLVDGVTVLNKALYPFDKTTRKMESLKKFFRLSKKDLRVIMIKLADRLHNMRTVKALQKKRRIKLATECMDVYIPITNLLGIWKVKSELEDLSFECLKPAQFRKIRALFSDYLEETKEKRKATVAFITRSLKLNGIRSQVIPQDISLLAHYRNYSAGNSNGMNTFRYLSFNVIVPKKKDCYTALGVLHGLFKPRYSKIKDYIATPKANSYRSLHTVVFGIKGIPTYFRIRTPLMHRINEYGILSNIYKYSAKNPKKAMEMIGEKTKWLEKVLEIGDELPSDRNFLYSLKMDVLNSRIFAFTPKGDIVDLPEEATALDFAYAVNVEIGHGARGAEIDGITSPLSRQLQTGDTVKIITARRPAPRLEWLDMVKTNEARQKIKAFFKEKGSDNSYRAGKKLLEEAIHHFQEKDIPDIPPEKIDAALKRFAVKNLRELLMMIGKGEILPRHVLNDFFSSGDIFKRKKTTPAKATYPITVIIGFKDRIGLLRDIASTVLRFKVNIIRVSVKTPESKGKEGLMELIIDINGLDQMMDVFTALEQVDNIIYVRKK